MFTYILREASASLLVQQRWAIPEPRKVERATVRPSRSFIYKPIKLLTRWVRRHTLFIMKKILLTIVVMVATFSFCANAQSVTADFSSLDKLVEKLDKACAKAPNPCGVGDIDGFVDGNKTAAKGAVDSAKKLHSLYSRQIGETEDGVQDVTITKPTLDDWLSLATAIATQTAGMAELGVSGKNAAESLKKVDKMKAIKLAKPLKWATDIMPVTGQALAEETKAIDQIIKLVKSENNL